MSGRRHRRAQRALGVSQTRHTLPGPCPPPADMPTVRLGTRTRVHGAQVTVQCEHMDRVGLQVHAGLHRFSLGLLVRWLNYTWRVCDISTEGVVLEAWGREAMKSEKLVHYQSLTEDGVAYRI